jgi:uncharacterized protein YjbI with pentapeptide repeats
VLEDADLSQANLSDAWLAGTDLKRADLSDAITTGARFEQTIRDEETISKGQLSKMQKS